MATSHTVALSAPVSTAEERSLLFIGNATVLIRYAGFTLLTDPNFLHRDEHVYLGFGLRSRRLTEPARQLNELPTIDAIALSHLHEDHVDRRVATTLSTATPIVTTSSAARALQRGGFQAALGLNTWDSVVFTRGEASMRVTSLPAQHGPRVVSRAMPSTMGSLIEFTEPEQQPYRIYISGDTLAVNALRDVARRFDAIDLGLFHLGGTRIFGILLTMDGEQGARAIEMIQPHTAVPIHYDDYDVFKSPLGEFQTAITKASPPSSVVVLERGDSLELKRP